MGNDEAAFENIPMKRIQPWVCAGYVRVGADNDWNIMFLHRLSAFSAQRLCAPLYKELEPSNGSFPLKGINDSEIINIVLPQVIEVFLSNALEKYQTR